MKITVFALCLLACFGCAHQKHECNLELIRTRHPELAQAMTNYPALTTDFMHTIAILENQAGGYR